MVSSEGKGSWSRNQLEQTLLSTEELPFPGLWNEAQIKLIKKKRFNFQFLIFILGNIFEEQLTKTLKFLQLRSSKITPLRPIFAFAIKRALPWSFSYYLWSQRLNYVGIGNLSYEIIIAVSVRLYRQQSLLPFVVLTFHLFWLLRQEFEREKLVPC